MLDSIIYGNPSQSYLPYLSKESPYDKHLSQLMKFGFPLNSSKATREELNELVDYVAALQGDEVILKRYKSYDHSLERVLADIIIKHGLDERAVTAIDQIIDDTLPIIAKLKFHFQRPRPYQLAKEYKLKLFPFDSVSASSPSYPSGHTLQSHLICQVLGNYYPENFSYFDALAKDIEYSRLYMGLHYQSDNDYAIFISETIFKDKAFKAKYGL
jgi:hypothetical protein